MPFIGNQPAEKYSSFQKQDFTTSATTSYTLDHPVSNQNEIALFINFVRQEPTAAYTASGTSLTLTSATTSSDDMYCVYLGKAVQTVNPPNSSVGSSQVSADLITGQTALGATPADTDELLISDAGTLKRVDFSHLKVSNTPAFEAHTTSAQSVSDATYTKLTFGTEVFDTDNAFDSTTNYRFTPQVAGKYFFYAKATSDPSGFENERDFDMRFYKNGSAVNHTQFNSMTGGNDSADGSTATTGTIRAVIDMNGSTDYVEAWGFENVWSGSGATIKSKQFGGYKIIT